MLFAATTVHADPVQQVVIDVGQREGAVRGEDHRAIQAAIDYAGSLGGGTVRIGEGRYTLRTCLTLRSGVKLIGGGEKTVLVLADGFRSPLTVDADANQRQVTVADPSGLAIGDRVLIGDDQQAWGFRITNAQVIGRGGPATFILSEPVRDDCMIQRHGWVERNHPAIGGWGIRDAAIEGFTIEGNVGRTPCPKRDGCRHGGIYLFECETIAIRRCTIRNFNGDGISFQVSRKVLVEECLTEKNAGHGLHPGSGSQEPTVHRNRSLGNGEDGIFVCWRVQRGLFESNETADNRGVGISIGHKDSDNLFRGNRIVANRGAGIEFRAETEAMGAHRNVFEGNTILDNGGCISIRGRHDDLVFRNNTLGYSKTQDKPRHAIASDGQAQRIVVENNELKNAAAEIEQLKPAN
ncbi:MAG: right-handed parallel beta-helix repeat-containing protein [Planctomycetota bacterium]|nr:right-handed parallel beta-helix repeat-containing protein [Planctomycetota bacterium]